MSCVQPAIDNINTTMSHYECASRKIKIGKVVVNNFVDNHLNRLCEMLPFMPVDVRTCPSINVFGPEEGKEFIRRHMTIG